MHVFVDETKDGSYLVASAVVMPADLAAARRIVAGLLKPGQRRLHFTKESPARRRQIIDAMCRTGARARVYDAAGHGKDHRAARRACIDQLVDDCALLRARLLVLERDDSLEAADRRWLYERVRAAGCAETLRYQHQRAHEEPLLAIPDAVAWCWAKGGEWRRRVEPLVERVREV
jgi:ribosomal protein L19E